MNNRTSRIPSFLTGCIAPAYGVMTAGILLICMLCTNIAYGRKEFAVQFLPAPVSVAIGLLFVLVIHLLCSRLAIPEGRQKTVLAVVFVLGFLFQLYAVSCYYFYADWDVAYVFRMARDIAHDVEKVNISGYFSRYPNNLFLVRVYAWLRRLFHVLGLHECEDLCLVGVQCFLCALTGVFTALSLQELFGNVRITAVGYILFALLIGTNPWISILYSDAMGLIFPAAMLYLYIIRHRVRQEAVVWLALGIIAIVGYKIKPQAVILLIALIAVELLHVWQTRQLRSAVQLMAGVLVGVLAASLLTQTAVDAMPIPLDPNKSYNMPHFFMMGMNPEEMGVYAREDVDYSATFSTVEERNAANMAEGIRRVRNMGPKGLVKQFIRKTMTNFYNGTFCWGGEGVHFYRKLIKRTDPAARFFRSFYYCGDHEDMGPNYVYWANMVQSLWLAVLLLSAGAAFVPKRQELNAIMLALIGLTVFETIFEARSRYFFTYVPLYIILAMCDYSRICAWISKRKKK